MEWAVKLTGRSDSRSNNYNRHQRAYTKINTLIIAKSLTKQSKSETFVKHLI